MFAGGTFIGSVAPAGCFLANPVQTGTPKCTGAVISQNAKVTGGTVAVPILAVVEHTTSRYLDDVTWVVPPATRSRP